MTEKQMIRKWIAEYMDNYTKTYGIDIKWGEPSVGITAANDSLYKELKTIISPLCALPSELLPDAKSVIAFCIPYKENDLERNIYAKIETNRMIENLIKYLNEKIVENGHEVSHLSPIYAYYEGIFVSKWSHRNAASIAGIAPLNNEDQNGYGSIITNWELPVDLQHRRKVMFMQGKRNLEKIYLQMCEG